MANLEIQIGADNSELNKKIAEAEKDLKELSQIKIDQIKLGLDTKEIDANIKDVKKHLADLKSVLKDTGNSFQGTQKPISDAGNTLNNFSRIAQDAPFGIMGIGNNITATAEAFSALSKQSGGAGNALKAVASSLAGPGGVLLAVSLVTTALTVMSQQGLSIGDVFQKLTGTFDGFKSSLGEVNKEAAKNSAEEIGSLKALVKVAQDETVSREKRLLAVQKLQDEYPNYFGNLTKEQLLSGNVKKAVDEITQAIKAKAKAQAISGKLTDQAEKEFNIQDKLEQKQKELAQATIKAQDALTALQNNPASESLAVRAALAARKVQSLKDEIVDVNNELKAVQAETKKWDDLLTKATEASIEVTVTPKIDKKKKIIDTPQVEPIDLKIPVKGITFEKFDLTKALNTQVLDKKTGIFSSAIERMEKDRQEFIARMQAQAQPIKDAVTLFRKDIEGFISGGLIDVFGGLGQSIGEALANGANVLSAVGNSIIGGLGNLLSAIGDKLIALGAASLAASLVLSTFGTAVGIGTALGAIVLGTALKVGGSFLGAQGKKGGATGGGGGNIQAGNSVSTPSSSVGVSQTNGGLQNVVFEISGQSLIGVLSNTLNKNVKLGGTITI